MGQSFGYYMSDPLSRSIMRSVIRAKISLLLVSGKLIRKNIEVNAELSSHMPRHRATSSQVSKSFESFIRMNSTLVPALEDRRSPRDIFDLNNFHFIPMRSDLVKNILNYIFIIHQLSKNWPKDRPDLPVFLEVPSAGRLGSAENTRPSQILVDPGLIVILLQPEIIL